MPSRIEERLHAPRQGDRARQSARNADIGDDLRGGMRVTAQSSEKSNGAGRANRSSALLTADEVAGLLQVTAAWVYAQTRADRIPHVRLGRYVRFRQDAIEQWVARIESGDGAVSR
jgi:excisionase family DNA binding protein